MNLIVHVLYTAVDWTDHASVRKPVDMKIEKIDDLVHKLAS